MTPPMRLWPLWLVLVGCTTVRTKEEVLPAADPSRLVFDAHLHVTMARAAKPLVHGEAGDGEVADFGGRYVNQVDEAGLKALGLRLALAAMWPPFEMRPGRDKLDEALHQMDELKQFTRDNGGFVLANSPKAARRALSTGRIVLIAATEGGEGIQSVDDVDQLWMRGVRSITVVHFIDNDLAKAAHGQMKKNLLGIRSDKVAEGGLTPLGFEAVRRMLELGMLVDISHASDKAAREVLEMARQRGQPVLYTHGGARALQGNERNISDELAREVAAAGGLIGVTIFDGMVKGVPKEEQWEGYVPGSCDDVIATWLHLAKVVDPRALVLGSDMNGFITRAGPGGSCPRGLRRAEDLVQVFDALEKRGVPKEAIDGMGEALLGLWEKVEAGASPEAKRRAVHSRRREHGVFAAP